MKPNKETYIDFIIEQLEKGNVQYKDVLLLFVTKFDLTKQTFVRYWKTANEAYKNKREALNELRDKETIAKEKEAVKTLILNKVERMRIAESIALGVPDESGVLKPSISDRLKALDYLSKIEGDYAASKIETNVSINENKEPIWIVKDFSKDANNT